MRKKLVEAIDFPHLLDRGRICLAGAGAFDHGFRIKTIFSTLVTVLLLVTPRGSAGVAHVESFTVKVKVAEKIVMPVDVYLPDHKKPAPVVMLAHGFTQNKKFHANQGRRLAVEGYVVLIPSLQRFSDHVGHGKDLRALLDWAEHQNADKSSPLFGRVNARRAAACGHSAGGLSALLAAATDERIRVLVLLDAVDWNGHGAKAAAQLRIPTLSVCAEPSEWNANGSPQKLAAALPEPKKTVKIPGANHLEAQDPANPLGAFLLGKANPERQNRFTDEMTAWIKQHLPMIPPPKVR